MINAESLIAWLDNERGKKSNAEWTDDTRKQVTEVYVKVQANMGRFKDKRQAIQDNRSLSPEGQRAAIATLANDSIGDYVGVGKLVERLDTELANAILFSVTSPITDPIVRQLRGQEIRDGLRGLDENERNAQFIVAAERDLDEVLDSMLTSPTGPLVSADVKRRTLDTRARRRNPKGYANWEQTVLLRGLVYTVIENTALVLISMGADAEKVGKELGIVIHDLVEEQRRAKRENTTLMQGMK